MDNQVIWIVEMWEEGYAEWVPQCYFSTVENAEKYLEGFLAEPNVFDDLPDPEDYRIVTKHLDTEC